MNSLLSPKLNRRSFLKNAGLGLAALSFPGCLKKTGKSIKKPNIIFFLADDLGYGELGCYGQNIIKTPNIDELSAGGMRFTQHYAGSPVCAPSRCVLMTGKHTGHAYIRNNGRPGNRKHEPEQGIFAGQNPIPDSEVTIAELLRQQGYATAAIGKWGLGYRASEGDPINQRFVRFLGQSFRMKEMERVLPRLYLGVVRKNSMISCIGNSRLTVVNRLSAWGTGKRSAPV